MALHRVLKLSNAKDFEEIISKGVTVVEFSADWCSPCLTCSPVFRDLSNQYVKYNFIEVDVDELYEICEKYGVGAAPAYQIYKDGDKIDQIIGGTKEALEEFIKKNNL